MTSSDSTSKNRLKLLEEMCADNPADPFLPYAAALEYIKLDMLDVARERLENLRIDHPEYLALYYQLGKLYENNGEFRLAIQIFKEGKTIAREQNDSKTFSELSEALLNLEN